MIEIDLSLPLSRFALEIHLRLSGRATAVLGPSGSGKTSLLESIAGLRAQAAGRISVDGETLLDSASGRNIPPERRRIGYVPQDALLFPHLSAAENVRFGAGRGKDSRRIFEESVETLEIGPLLPQYPATLSGGERQRVALARALAIQPRLLLLDEPLAAVDVELKSRILPYLLRIRDERAIPFLYVTHNAGEAEVLAGEALVLRDGHVAAQGPAREVVRSLSRFDPSASFDNVFDGVIASSDPAAGVASLQLAGGANLSVPAHEASPGERCVFTVAPEEILLSLQPLFRISARNVLVGEVAAIDGAGYDAMASVRAAGTIWRVHVTAAAVADLRLACGTPVWLAVKTQSLRRLR